MIDETSPHNPQNTCHVQLSLGMCYEQGQSWQTCCCLLLNVRLHRLRKRQHFLSEQHDQAARERASLTTISLPTHNSSNFPFPYTVTKEQSPTAQTSIPKPCASNNKIKHDSTSQSTKRPCSGSPSQDPKVRTLSLSRSKHAKA